MGSNLDSQRRKRRVASLMLAAAGYFYVLLFLSYAKTGSALRQVPGSRLHGTSEDIMRYRVQVLPEKVGQTFLPAIINDAGQILGALEPAAGGLENAQPSVLEPKSVHYTRIASDQYYVVAFNNVGEIVLRPWRSDGISLLWTRSRTKRVPFVPKAINDAAKVIGFRSTFQDGQRRFVGCTWDHGTTTDVPGGRPDIIPLAINNSAEIVGVDDIHSVAFGKHRGPITLYLLRSGHWDTIARLGTDLLSSSTQVSIDKLQLTDSGTVLVSYTIVGKPDDTSVAALWSAGKLTGVGTEGSTQAKSTNDAGIVVGKIWSSKSREWHPFVWENGEIYDLNARLINAPGVVIEEAISINNKGSILCMGSSHGHYANFVLVPSD